MSTGERIALLILFIIFVTTGIALYTIHRRSEFPEEVKVEKPKIRGVFLYMYDFPNRNIAKNFSSYIEKISESGFNIVLPFVIHAGGLADYRSKIVPNDLEYLSNFRADEDPLRMLVEEAHKRNIKVWAWVVSFRTSRDIIVNHPDWGVVDENNRSQLEGPIFSKYGWYYLSPVSKGAREYVKSYIIELVKNYNVDGINLEDDFGFPPGISDFSAYARSSFEFYIGKKVQSWPYDVLPGGDLRNEWINWRAKVVTDFLRELRNEIKNINPNVVISADVSYDPNWSKEAMGVDWVTWIKEGLVDVISPMIYHRDEGMNVLWVKAMTERVVETVKNVSSYVKVIPCIGGSLATTKSMPPNEWIQATKATMLGNASGVLVFADVCLDASGAWNAFKEYFLNP
ncbi:MAG: glycoside hydrolase family 10 protein [Thermoproteota archaeon]|jgi:uncharacterized lipoprotein YddW (UPF0748 family)